MSARIYEVLQTPPGDQDRLPGRIMAKPRTGPSAYPRFRAWLGLLLLALHAAIPGRCQVGIIQRVQPQQVIATLPPTAGSLAGAGITTQAFMTSPSGTFRAVLIRLQTSPGAGGLGNDFCYVDVVNWAAQQSTWESPCAPVTTANPCTLLLSDPGLQLLNGNRDVWNTGANQYRALVLQENGDLQLVDQNNAVVWKASDSPLINQRCGTAQSPGSPPVNPPFASPLTPFGQPFSPLINQPFPGVLPLNAGPAAAGPAGTRGALLALAAAFVLAV